MNHNEEYFDQDYIDYYENIRCPICGYILNDDNRIDRIHKYSKIVMFGVFGMDDIGKTWECPICRSKF